MLTQQVEWHREATSRTATFWTHFNLHITYAVHQALYFQRRIHTLLLE